MSLIKQIPRLYPLAPQDDIVDDYHGTLVADPYRWLEDPEAAATRAWVAAQNELTLGLLHEVPARARVKARLTRLWDYPKMSTPWRRGGRSFYFKNDGLQNQPVLYWQPDAQAEPKVLLDPNTLRADGTAALTNQVVSRDGALLAYGVSESGSDWQRIRVRRVTTGEDLGDEVRWCKFAGIAWKPDNSGFYYNRYPQPGTVPEAEQHRHNRVYWHQLGTAADADCLVYERPDAPDLAFVPFASEDDAYLLLYVWHGTDTQNRIYYRPMDGEGDFVRLLDDADAMYNFITNIGPIFYFHTDLDAPRGRIIAIDITQPARAHWREILPQQEDVIALVTAVHNHLAVVTMQDAHHILKLYDLDGNFLRQVALPGIGSILQLTGRLHDSDMYLSFTSFLFPTSIFRYDFLTDTLSSVYHPTTDFDAAAYETRQVFCTSKDGTRVPIFVTMKKGLRLDGNNPTILYGYGGFNISVTPAFWVQRTVWLEAGGIFAVANLRGGNEYGEAWHQAGMLDNKQNVFDDFIAAAEYLIAHGYTSSRRLAIHGGSNGGLLVGACMTQRPDLYGAVICAVPVLDMLRYHQFTVGKYWVGEYGSAEADADQFATLYAYSPLHNLRPDVTYPPLLITTADTDDRVVPAHANKFAATIQALHTNDNPALIRIETRAGHGLGKPTAKLIEEEADVYAFLWDIFDME
ncbi:MAG: S9 family peptidase [Anaerolineales bacterium]|nr:S9 family peptidase [Anaerolineales bacterium]MCB8954576.1 S9 family peptidase [Ardenticatenales bacterium]